MKEFILFLCIIIIIMLIPNIMYADNDKPDIWPTWGRVSSLFGEARKTHIHMGLDIANDIGIFIYSTADGEVIYADYDGGFGNKIIIEHKNNYKTIYAHLENIYVCLGDNVLKYDVIGTMGNTGNSTGSHLHYEVLLKEVNKNPMDYLP